MKDALTAIVLFIALEHVWFLVLEMFLWTKPIGRKTFRKSAEFARESAGLAANMGLYNGFLVAGLLWSVFHTDPAMGHELRVFFLGCVVVAGIFGGLTVSRRILYLQALPALVGLGLAFAG